METARKTGLTSSQTKTNSTTNQFSFWKIKKSACNNDLQALFCFYCHTFRDVTIPQYPDITRAFCTNKLFFQAKHTRFYKKKHIFVMSCMRWKPPRVESGARYIYIKKAYLSALVLTVHELRNFKLLVKNKATGTPLRMFIYALIGSWLQMPSAMMVFYMHRRGAFSVARFD